MLEDNQERSFIRSYWRNRGETPHIEDSDRPSLADSMRTKITPQAKGIYAKIREWCGCVYPHAAKFSSLSLEIHDPKENIAHAMPVGENCPTATIGKTEVMCIRRMPNGSYDVRYHPYGKCRRKSPR